MNITILQVLSSAIDLRNYPPRITLIVQTDKNEKVSLTFFPQATDEVRDLFNNTGLTPLGIEDVLERHGMSDDNPPTLWHPKKGR